MLCELIIVGKEGELKKVCDEYIFDLNDFDVVKREEIEVDGEEKFQEVFGEEKNGVSKGDENVIKVEKGEDIEVI